MKKTTSKKRTKLVLPVYDLTGKEKKEIELPKEMFNVSGKKELLAQYVRVYLANNTPKPGSTKTRGEVSGSTRKIYRQKGTGRARHGDIKAPIFVGGGIAHGPKPRYPHLKLNKKQIKKAMFLALTLIHKEGRIVVLDDEFLTIEPKTKKADSVFSKFADGKNPSLLLVYPADKADNLIQATKNLPYMELVNVKSINPYLFLKHKKILFLQKAIEELKDIYLGKKDENK